ncbi:MAG: CoA pyrophosphatase [Gemmatimonadota bacterium]|nr:CoA pyrophosphatase [Gemmatimonadota bacterium]
MRVERQTCARRAAVALILRLLDAGELELLMIERAVYAGDPWSGQVAFPGGRQEPDDASLEETAMRETREETAIDLATRGVILGRLDELEPRMPVHSNLFPSSSLPPTIVITPFVAVADDDVAIVTSPEVAQAFWVSVAALRDPAAAREVELVVRGVPRRVAGYQYGGHVIWGLTERILRQFLVMLGG